MDKKEILDDFGKVFIKESRDMAFWVFDQISRGEMRGQTAQRLIKSMKTLAPVQQGVVRAVVLNTVNDMCHYFLWMLQQNEHIKITFEKDDSVYNLNELSDGLCGELYNDEGWIKRFSEYPFNELDLHEINDN